MHKFLYWLIFSNFLFHCHILDLKFFCTLSFQKCSIAFCLLCSLLNLQFKTLSDLFTSLSLILCCGSVSSVMCESDAVQLRPAVDVLVLYSLSQAIRHNKHIDSHSQLNTVRLTHNTRHAATAPNY